MATFDVEKLKSIANRYQGYGENAVPLFSNERNIPQTTGNFVQNVVSSLGRLGTGAAGTVGNFLKNTFWNEPGALIGQVTGGIKKQFDIAKNQYGAVQQIADVQRRLKAGQPVSKQEIEAINARSKQNMALMGSNAWNLGSTFVPFTKNWREKYLPVASTVATLATLGSAAPISGAVKGGTVAPEAVGAGSKALRFGSRILEDTFGIGKTFGKSLPVNIAGKIARTGLLVKPTIQDIANLPEQIGKGKYGEAAINAALLASGGLEKGPIGTIGSIASKAKTWAAPAFKSGEGVFDLIKIKNGQSVMQAFQQAATKAPKQATKTENTLKLFQDYLIQQWGDAKTASKALNEYIGNKDLSKMSLKQLTTELENFRTSDEAIRQTAVKLAKKGLLTDAAGKKISVEQAKYVGAVRSPGGSTDDLIIKLSTSSNPTQAKTAISKFVKENPDFVKIPQNRRVLQGIQESGAYGDDAVKMAKERFIKTQQVFFGGKAKQSPQGYVAGLRTGARFNELANVAELQTGKKGMLSPIGSALSKLGISPQSSSEGQARFISEKIKSNFDKALGDAGINRTGTEVINKLRKVANTKKGVFDIRQLRNKEIAQALNVDVNDAKLIKNAYKKGVSSLSVEERGLAGKLTDINLNINPLAAPYSRLQNVAKYELNPFFSAQERIETRTGVAALTGTTRKPGADYTKQVKELDDLGFWKYSGFGGEGADVGNIANITSKLKPGQKETLAAGIESLANKQGKTISEFVRDPKNASIMQDFKTVVQYPDKGFTSSNLSKMLNLVVFPSRYNIKVTQFALKQLAKQPGVVQAQVIRGIHDYNQFMESPQGIKFQADNKEVLSLLNYFTPLNNITQIMNILSGKARTPADFGLIGGLPFGVISQALQGQGLIQTDTPYVDPRTGEIYPDKIPVTLKARAYKLMADLIGTMYNYPGRQAGFPKGFAKKDINEVIPKMLMGTPSPTDFESVTRTNVSPEDAKRMQVLQGAPADLRSAMTVPKGIKPAQVNRLTEADIIKGFNFPKTKKAKKEKVRPVPIRQLIGK